MFNRRAAWGAAVIPSLPVVVNIVLAGGEGAHSARATDPVRAVLVGVACEARRARRAPLSAFIVRRARDRNAVDKVAILAVSAIVPASQEMHSTQLPA
jgi:hypothetical protein